MQERGFKLLDSFARNRQCYDVVFQSSSGSSAMSESESECVHAFQERSQSFDTSGNLVWGGFGCDQCHGMVQVAEEPPVIWPSSPR